MERFNISLEIDCDPLNRHQEEFGRYIFNEILSKEYRRPDFTFFGNWTWKVMVNEEQQKKIGKFLTRQYNCGNVRWACWSKIEKEEK